MAKIEDVYETPFGIRSFYFDSLKGFFLNGKRVKINGVCNHHDLGCLGAAVNTRAIERQLEILKGMGCNGIRTSHNPPAPELLDLCDRMGFIVMDEAFDMWEKKKSPFDYALYWNEWHEKDLRDQILQGQEPSLGIHLEHRQRDPGTMGYIGIACNSCRWLRSSGNLTPQGRLRRPAILPVHGTV